MPSVVFLPEMSDTFDRMKGYLDRYVYDKKPSAMWKMNNLTVSGSGFSSTDTVRIMVRRGSNESNTHMTTPDGRFIYVVSDMPFDETTYIEVYKNGDFMNSTVIDQYYYLAVIYLLGLEFVRMYSEVAHGKQDIFIYPTLDETVETAQDHFTTDIANFGTTWTGSQLGESETVGLRYYENQKGVYPTSPKALRDKLTLPIPGDVYGQSPEDVVHESIIVSEHGPVMHALKFLQDIYSLVGVTKLFVYPLEFTSTFNVGNPTTANEIPRVSSLDPLWVEFPEGASMRYGWQLLPLTSGTVEYVDLSGYQADMAPGGDDLFVWIYVDGVMNFANSLEKKHSKVQPTPEIRSVSVVVTPSDVSYDDSDGSLTGVPYQAYATLKIGTFEHPVFAVADTPYAYDVSGTVYPATFVERDIIGLGVCTVTDNIRVEYTEYVYNRHLCVARLTWPGGDPLPHIAALHRIWNLPGHIRAGSVDQLAGVQIFIKFDPLPPNYADIIKSIALIIREIVPIVSDYQPYINPAKDDQDTMDEDSINWPEQFKGYMWLGTLVSPEEYVPPIGSS